MFTARPSEIHHRSGACDQCDDRPGQSALGEDSVLLKPGFGPVEVSHLCKGKKFIKMSGRVEVVVCAGASFGPCLKEVDFPKKRRGFCS